MPFLMGVLQGEILPKWPPLVHDLVMRATMASKLAMGCDDDRDSSLGTTQPAPACDLDFGECATLLVTCCKELGTYSFGNAGRLLTQPAKELVPKESARSDRMPFLRISTPSLDHRQGEVGVQTPEQPRPFSSTVLGLAEGWTQDRKGAGACQDSPLLLSGGPSDPRMTGQSRPTAGTAPEADTLGLLRRLSMGATTARSRRASRDMVSRERRSSTSGSALPPSPTSSAGVPSSSTASLTSSPLATQSSHANSEPAESFSASGVEGNNNDSSAVNACFRRNVSGSTSDVTLMPKYEEMAKQTLKVPTRKSHES